MSSSEAPTADSVSKNVRTNIGKIGEKVVSIIERLVNEKKIGTTSDGVTVEVAFQKMQLVEAALKENLTDAKRKEKLLSLKDNVFISFKYMKEITGNVDLIKPRKVAEEFIKMTHVHWPQIISKDINFFKKNFAGIFFPEEKKDDSSGKKGVSETDKDSTALVATTPTADKPVDSKEMTGAKKMAYTIYYTLWYITELGYLSESDLEILWKGLNMTIRLAIKYVHLAREPYLKDGKTPSYRQIFSEDEPIAGKCLGADISGVAVMAGLSLDFKN